jgi:hypothetical protein
VLPVLLRELDEFLNRLREAHAVDAAFDSKALDDGFLDSKVRRHFASTSWIDRNAGISDGNWNVLDLKAQLKTPLQTSAKKLT